MTTVAGAVQQLRDALAVVYPTRVAELSNTTGRVTCIIGPDGGTWETGTMCDPPPGEHRTDVLVVAAGTGQQSVLDLLQHLEPVAALISGAGWEPGDWSATETNDRPALRITATTTTNGN